MTARRSSGPGAQAAKSALTSTQQAVSPLYSQIVYGLPIGVVILQFENPQDAKTLRIIDVNPALLELTGSISRDLLGKTLADFPKFFETPFPKACLEAIATGEPREILELPYGDDCIRQGIYSLRVLPLSSDRLGVILERVGERDDIERVLLESEELFRLLVQSVQEYAIFNLDPQGHVVSWNRGAERVKGYTAEEILGKHFSVFYPSEDVENGKPARVLGTATEKGQTEDEGWRVRRDGSRFWANVVVTALRDSKGTLLGFAKVTRDISERREKEESLTKAKELLELRVEQRTAILSHVNEELRTEIAERERAEKQLRVSLSQLRALAARLQRVREEERAAMSREIHDELGQACTAIKMDLSLIGRKLSKSQSSLRRRIETAMNLADDMISTLRRIASQLRPRTLDDLGLPAALEAQAQEFESRTRIPCRIALPHELPDLDPDVSTAIFRIFQESLTNILRHAHATLVEARLEKDADHLIFEVRDNGKGFNPEEAMAAKSLGLVGMHERALLLNGELKVEGVPGAGTTLTLRIPLPTPALSSRRSK